MSLSSTLGKSIFVYLLILSTSTQAQTISNTLDIIGLTSSQPANVAFSVRKLSTAYSGPLFRLRVGSNYYDIYPDASANEISLNSLISASTLFTSTVQPASTNTLGSLAATEAYVAIWYDQSGNSNNLSNPNTANQPMIIRSSSLITEGSNNRPVIYWDSRGRVLQLNSGLNSNGQVIIVNKFGTSGDRDGFLLGDNGRGSYFWHSDDSPPRMLLFDSRYVSTSVGTGAIFQNGNYKPNISLTTYNQTLGINSIAPRTANDNTFWDNIGTERGNTNGAGTHRTTPGASWSEILSFPNKLNQILRSGVESNQSAYFGITLNPTNDPNDPTISISSPSATLTSCAGFVSNSPITFTINGSNLTADVIITAPSNFEISSSTTGTFASSLSITTSGTVSQTLYARLTASAPTGIRSGTITATSTGASTVTTTINGTVNSLPLITISATEASMTANDNTVCKNASVTLTASGGDTYVWNTGATLTSITPTPGITTTFTVTGTTTSSGCSNTATKLITVYAAPTLSAGSLSLCAEATYLIDKTTDVPATNGWSTSDPNVFSVNSAGYITATASGAATATITYTDACSQSVSQTVNVVTSDITTQITSNRTAYKFNGNPQGPTLSGSTINYVGYDGYSYYGQTQPTQVGFYKANIQTDNQAGCPNRFYIFNCTTCNN